VVTPAKRRRMMEISENGEISAFSSFGFAIQILTSGVSKQTQSRLRIGEVM
jgi:hypothetical protein